MNDRCLSHASYYHHHHFTANMTTMHMRIPFTQWFLCRTQIEYLLTFIWNAHRKWIIFSTVIVFSVLVNSFVLEKKWKGKKMQSHDNSTFFCFLFEHSVLHSFCSRHQNINYWLIINVHHLWELYCWKTYSTFANRIHHQRLVKPIKQLNPVNAPKLTDAHSQYER